MDDANGSVILNALFDTLHVPVFVCKNDREMTVSYMNTAARLTFAPTQAVENIRLPDAGGPKKLAEVLRFQSDSDFSAFDAMRTRTGVVAGLPAKVIPFRGRPETVLLHANAAKPPIGDSLVVYVQGIDATGWADPRRVENLLTRLLETIYHETTADTTIRSVLGIVGAHVRADRAVVFEETPPDATRNTYEWCAEGIRPVIQELQNLRKSEYTYGAIMHESGMLVIDDATTVPEPNRSLLARYGVRALALLPLYHFNQPIGFIGLHDCGGTRQWNIDDLSVLKLAAGLVSSLIMRRDAENSFQRSMGTLKTVTDNLDSLIYIADPQTHKLVFVSRSLARLIGKEPAEVIGNPCWEMFDSDGPCPFCNMQLLRDKAPGERLVTEQPHIWEFHSALTGKYYMVTETMIKWVDGSDVHLTTAVDISYRKQYEETLRRTASTDPMTEVYNRQWATAKLRELLSLPIESRKRLTLCFLDIDGLKTVNDRFGHNVGDDMIINAISIVHSCIRKNDMICRWGGDEFLVILNCNLEDAMGVVNKINFAIEHFNETGGKQYFMSVSAGLVDFAAPVADLDELVDRADKAMYAVKMEKSSRRSVRLRFGDAEKARARI